MLKAANLAGEAINISKTSAPHALSYLFTSYFNISHIYAVAITFNEFLKYNYLNKDKSTSEFDINNRFKFLFNITQTQNIYELQKFFHLYRGKLKLRSILGARNYINKKIDLILKNVNSIFNNPIH